MGANVGERLREVRKRRGLSQRELANESGVSLSLIRKLEQGEREDTRLETVRRLAAALRVPTTQLVVASRAEDDVVDADAQWKPLRRVLLTSSVVDTVDEPPTTAGVRQALNAAMPLFSGDRFVELSTILPSLLRDAEALVRSDPEGRAVRARILQLTGWLLTQMRQFDAAEAALERSMDESSDRLHSAATASIMCWLLLRRGRLGEARDLASRWADEVEPRLSRATPAELSAWGWLLLRMSAAAVRDNRPGEAEDAIRLAHAAAVALGREYTPEGNFLQAFGPVTVALKRAENAMVVDRPDLVLKLAANVPVHGLRPTSNNRNRHLLDVANAHARTRQYAEAVDILTGLRATAPQWFPKQRYAQDIVSGILARRRTLTPEMRSLADAVGMPV